MARDRAHLPPNIGALPPGSKLTADLAFVRARFAADPRAARPWLPELCARVEQLVGEAGPPAVPLMLGIAGQLQLMLRATRYPGGAAALGPPSSTHVLIAGPHGEGLYLPQRGPWKRLFPATLTVSAGWHGAASVAGALAAARADLGLVLDVDRLVRIGPERGHRVQVCSAEYWAVTSEEERALRELDQGDSMPPPDPHAVLARYQPTKRSLTVFTVSGDAEAATAFETLTATVTRHTGVPPIHRVRSDAWASLYAYRLSADEDAGLRDRLSAQNARRDESLARLLAGARTDAVASLLRSADADEWTSTPWSTFRRVFTVTPLRVALDLVAPYLGSPRIVQEIEAWLATSPP